MDKDGNRERGGRGEVNGEEVPSPKIKCRQYLSLIEKCAHFLSSPVFPAPGMMSRRL